MRKKLTFDLEAFACEKIGLTRPVKMKASNRATTDIAQIKRRLLKAIQELESKVKIEDFKVTLLKISEHETRDAALAQVAAGGTDAEVQKLGVTVNSLNGAIAGVDASIQQAVATANLQQQQNQAAEKIYKAGVVVQSASGFSGEVSSSMDGLASVAPDDAKVPQWNP